LTSTAFRDMNIQQLSQREIKERLVQRPAIAF